MKKLNLLIFIAVAFLLLPRCSIAGRGEYRKNFVTDYGYVKDINLFPGLENPVSPGAYYAFGLDWAGISYINYRNNYSEYKQLVEYYGDTYFNRKDATPEVAVANEILSVDIVSSADFNEYPAGVSLRDIIYIRYYTVWPYISSGYQSARGFHEKCLSLSEFTPEDMKMLGRGGYFILFSFTSQPAVKQHTFTVTVTARDPLSPVDAPPLVWSDTVEVTFQ